MRGIECNSTTRMLGNIAPELAKLAPRFLTVELHSMLLTISPFMFWKDPKTFSKSILSLLVFARKWNFRITLAVRKNLKQLLSWNLSHVCLETVVLLLRIILLLVKY